jgi:hypothetical protein
MREDRPRQFHAFCIGAAKTGTHSIGKVFAKSYRSDHEPEGRATIEFILDVKRGRFTEPEILDYVQARDRRLDLEMESSHPTYFLLEYLLALFDRAKFILTVRDCLSWVTSFISHQHRARTPKFEPFIKLRDLRFAPNGRAPHPPEESGLAELGLYTLDEYLSYWSRHNRTVIDRVPSDRLLIVRTHEIGRDLSSMSRFLSIDPESLDSSGAEEFKARTKLDVLSKIPADHLRDKVERHCGELMRDLFPGWELKL